MPFYLSYYSIVYGYVFYFYYTVLYLRIGIYFFEYTINNMCDLISNN